MFHCWGKRPFYKKGFSIDHHASSLWVDGFRAMIFFHRLSVENNDFKGTLLFACKNPCIETLSHCNKFKPQNVSTVIVHE